MILIVTLLVIFVALVVGANNSSNVVASLYGSRMMKYGHASAICALFVLIGALFEGKKIAVSIAGGFIKETIPYDLQLGVLLITGLMMLSITLLRFPMSATQVMIGSLLGGAYALNIDVDEKFTVVAISAWYFSLVAATLVGFLTYSLLMKLSSVYRKSVFGLRRLYFIGTIISSLFVAYTIGAGIIGLVGSLCELYFVAPIAAAFGIIFFGKRTSRKIGREMVVLDPPRALSVQFSGAIVTEIFLQLHIPVSVTQAMIGGIIGTSLTKGRFDLSVKNMRNLLISWTLVPIISFMITFLLVKLY